MIGAADRARQRDKVVTVGDLPKIRERFRDRRIIHCHGAFDLVHLGHLTHFEEAREMGDLLVVTLTGDAHITKKRSVTFSEDQRARQVAALEIVDYVAVIQEPTALSAIEALHPDVYVKGPEYADLTLDKSRSIYHEFRDISDKGFSLDQLKQFIARAVPLKVCVIGETITDEWVDVELTNLSTQSRCVAGIECSRVKQVGGVGIIARHLANFVSEVHCFTNGPATDAPANVRHTALDPGTLIETRFVEAGRPVFKTKSVGLSHVVFAGLPRFDDYDLVIIADFGHGLLDAATLNQRIADRTSATVAAMAQVNSSNYGYNLPIKYAGADYYSLNRTEAELCLHERHQTLEGLATHSAPCRRTWSRSSAASARPR